MPHRQERVHILAAFGDITNFRAYTRRLSDDPRQKEDFLRKFDDVVDELESRTGYFVKDLSDGFLCISKIVGKNGSSIVRFINDMRKVTDDINALITSEKYPRPDGFRTRITAGMVIQKIRHNGAIDFRGAHIDLASTMLQVDKTRPLIVHESARQLMSTAEIQLAGFAFEALAAPKFHRANEQIYSDELGALWTLEKKKQDRGKPCRHSTRCAHYSPEA